MTTHKLRLGVGLATAAALAVNAPALAQTAAPAATMPAPATTPAPATSPAPASTTAAPAPAAAAPPAGLWYDGIHFSAQVDGGISLNPFRPGNGLNFGQGFTDHANQFQLNQVLLTATKPLDPKDPNLQLGFKLQLMYGSDARWSQNLGEFNRVDPGARYQLDMVEADVQAHLPIPSTNGMDIKAGQYPTPLGFETIDPSTNAFYSHSYIFQWGLPFQHTGVLTTTHVNDMLDIYAGLDTGTNTTFGPLGENNSALGGIGGFNLTFMGGNLTVLALTHIGPEQPSRVLSPLGLNANGAWRAYNDVVVTYKASDALTLVTELNWARDSFGTLNKPVNAFGAAQYAAYTLSDTLTLNGRIEVFRDDNNYFVAAYQGNNDPVRVEQGLAPLNAIYAAPGGGGTTYGEITLGVTYKPAVPPPVTGLLIRPEVRWDHAFTGNDPFNQNTTATKGTNNNFTFAADAVVTF